MAKKKKSKKKKRQNRHLHGASLIAQLVKNLPAMQETQVQLLQYFCLKNPMDRGAWQATVYGVARVGHYLATKPPQAFISLCRLLVIFKAKAVAIKSSLI